jgi:hypothetical protein
MAKTGNNDDIVENKNPESSMTKSHRKKGYSKFSDEDQQFDNLIQEAPLEIEEGKCSSGENSLRGALEHL